MNFNDSPDEAQFRAIARDWIAQNAPRALEAELRSLGFAPNALRNADLLRESRKWQARKAEGGWACIHWPSRFGGRDASPIERVIWKQEEGPFGHLSHLFFIGQNMCGPTLMAFANEEQQARYLAPLASGEEIWCQLFSESGAGSDLAGIRTRAVRDGDEWVIDGQKLWTSGAHFSDFGLLLTRTDPTVAKHRGLTMFFVDMRSPGIEIRPIHQADGGAEFNEVYLAGVRIPDAQRLGAPGDGWKVSLTTLMNERLSHGTGMPTGFDALFDLCCDLPLGEARAIDDPEVRAKLAAWAARDSGLRITGLRLVGGLAPGELPGAESSIGKLVAASMMQDIAAYALDLQGASGLLSGMDQPWADARFQTMLLRSPATRIEGGTDEILRNIIAERVLGLPADLRVDKDVPFNALP
ncbi:MAG: acyl-CoA dehydrogenase family protein [Sphingobium sp.]